MNKHTRPSMSYSRTAQVLHWLLAALIVTQFILAKLADWAGQTNATLEQLALLANHKSLGLTILVLVLVRIVWRLTHPSPPLPASMNQWQRLASHISHYSLYALMLVLPLSGWLMAATSAYGLSWFNVFEVPRLVETNVSLSEQAEGIHAILGNVLLALVLVHFAAALFHHFIVKDMVLKRMSSPILLVSFAGLTALLVFSLKPANAPLPTDALTPASTALQTDNRPDPQHNLRVDTALSNIPLPASPNWEIDYEQSVIRFTAEQAGAQFSGVWTQWEADIAFDEQPLAARFIVRIRTAGADSNDEERDSTLRDPDWFDVNNYPLARFELDHAERVADNNYKGVGQLTIKTLTTPTPFFFTIESKDGIRTLTGQAKLDRLALQLGTGEWTDTSWVGQFVDVDVRVVTR